MPQHNGITPVDFALAGRDIAGFSALLGSSFARYGFAVIENHGLDQSIIDGCLAAAKSFFALPETVKRAYARPEIGYQRGYTPLRIETAKGAAIPDVKEFWHVGRDLPPGHRYAGHMAPNIWPAEVPQFQPMARGLFQAFDAAGLRLLSAIARYLSLAPDFFESKVEEGNSILRILHYPPQPDAEAGVRAGAHEDINVITLLLGAEEAGLEVLDRDGHWLPINPPPGALVVNIGDMLQRLTNHRLPSTSHRVVNPSRERAAHPRYSMPFFLHFNSDFLIETLAGCISAEAPNRYPQPITAHGYLEERLREIRLV